jgi:hypothetical protein
MEAVLLQTPAWPYCCYCCCLQEQTEAPWPAEQLLLPVLLLPLLLLALLHPRQSLTLAQLQHCCLQDWLLLVVVQLHLLLLLLVLGVQHLLLLPLPAVMA